MSQSPDWDLLPGQPRAFFELEEGFDRKDLKRAYNGLLRRFKPERFPAEFQRIRAAYEELEDALRYGTLPAATAAQAARAQPTEPVETAPALWTTYAPGGGSELLARLEAAPERDPQDWLALALLREPSDPKDPWPFLETVLEGAAATQGSPWLLHTLWKAGRDSMPPKVAAQFLQQLARTVPNIRGLPSGWYVFATSPQWERLLQELPFQTFEELLRRCQERLGPTGYDAFLVLRLRLLSRGALRISDAWREATVQDVEERYHQLPEDLQGEYDRYVAFAHYLSFREEFLNGSSLRADVDRVLIAGLTGTERDADRELIQTMHRVLEDREALFEGFPVGEQGPVDGALQLLGWMANETYARQKSGSPYRSPTLIRSRLNEFMFRLEREVRRTPAGMADIVLLYVAWLGFLGGVGGALFGIGKLTGLDTVLGEWGFVLWIVLLVLAAKFVYPHVVRHLLKVWDPILYRKAWRPRTAQFMAENFAEHPVLVHLLQNLETKGVTDQYRLAAQLSWDPALELHSIALAFAD